MTPAARWLLFGTDQPPTAALDLHAGRLAARLRGTRLGPITFDGHEVWHGVDFLYRDERWGTPEAVIDGLEHSETTQGFQVRIRGHVPAAGPLDFHITIEAGERALRYEVTAAPRADVATSRTGIVVLHPQFVAGRPVQVEHIDGRTSTSTFPTQIAPWPPFTLVRAIRHPYVGGAWAECRFAGDDFELEDQRNNADASFKTYSRSNLMPRPYALHAGAVLRQSVDLRIEGEPARGTARTEAPVCVRVQTQAGALPGIGISITPSDLEAPSAASAVLRVLRPALLHLVLERPDEPFDAVALARLLQEAGKCALRLDVDAIAVHRADTQLHAIAQALAAARVQPQAVAAFPSTPPVLAAARRAFPQTRIGGGTPYFFTQLNRMEDLGPVDFLTFTTSAVVHGAEDDEIMTGLASLPAMLETLRARHGPVPVQVGPSSIGALRSPFGPPPASVGAQRLPLARRDPRTSGLYGAAWALGYVMQLVHAGAQAITVFGLSGAAPFVEQGTTTPAFEVLRLLSAPGYWRCAEVTAPEAVAALGLERDGRTRLLLANLRGDPVELALTGPSLPVQIECMDADALQRRAVAGTGAGRAWREIVLRDGMLRLPPYAVAFV